MDITLDLETIPTENPAVIEDIAAGIEHPANMSKAETIAKWEQENKPAVVQEAVKKTAFDGTYGSIVVIGYAIDDAEPAALYGPEKDVLGQFFVAVSEAGRSSYASQGGRADAERNMIFVGHNLVGFDLKFLWKRAVINGIKMPAALLKACRAKPWDGIVADTMMMWDQDRDKRISLDRLCKALGIPTSKGDMDGSKAYDAYKAGEIERIAQYCCDDIRATRAVYKRLTFQ